MREGKYALRMGAFIGWSIFGVWSALASAHPELLSLKKEAFIAAVGFAGLWCLTLLPWGKLFHREDDS